MADTNLALDGPLNGAFITKAQADANGYVLGEWTTGEQVYIHEKSPLTEEEAFPSLTDDGEHPVDQTVPAEHR
jgi:hypothetical protein